MATYGLKQIALDLRAGKLPASASGDLAKSRLAVCQGCEHFGKMSRQCKLCNCFMDLKVYLLEAECPCDYW